MRKKIIIITIISSIIIMVGISVKNLMDNKKDKENILIEDTYSNNSNDENEEIINDEEKNKIMQLYLKINNRTLTVLLENNSSVDALIDKLKQNDYGII